MNENELIEDATAAFRRITGLPLSRIETEWHSADTTQLNVSRGDALLELELMHRRLRFVAECKRRIDRASLIPQIKSQLDAHRSSGLPLLIADYITVTMADRCRQLGLNFIDAAGNGYLKDQDLFVFVTGGKKPELAKLAAPNFRGGTSAGSLRMIFALVCMPGLLSAPYRDIVKTSGVALGSVGWIFFDLESRGLISSKDKNKQRHFLDLPRLREEWAINYTNKLRPQLQAQRFRAEDPDWWKNDLGLTEHFLWGGEVAAYLLDGYLKPATQTLYLKPGKGKASIGWLVAKYRLRADQEGPIEILAPFWKFEDPNTQRGIVPSLLVYSDLLATLDSRATEAALLLKRNHLDGPASTK